MSWFLYSAQVLDLERWEPSGPGPGQLRDSDCLFRRVSNQSTDWVRWYYCWGDGSGLLLRGWDISSVIFTSLVHVFSSSPLTLSFVLRLLFCFLSECWLSVCFSVHLSPSADLQPFMFQLDLQNSRRSKELFGYCQYNNRLKGLRKKRQHTTSSRSVLNKNKERNRPHFKVLCSFQWPLCYFSIHLNFLCSLFSCSQQTAAVQM